MKIAIDVTQVVYGTGVSVYTKELIKALLTLDKENKYILFGGALRRSKDLRSFFKSLNGNFSARIVPFPPRFADLIWNRMEAFPIETIVGKIDVFHSSDWTQPPTRAFSVTTIHDLVPIKYPDLSDPRIVSTHMERLKLVKRKVDRVIVPSKETYSDLLDMGFKEERLRIIPEAPNPAVAKASQKKVEQAKRKFNINKPYLLSVGINPRKNTDRILAAYSKLHKDLDVELVFIGHPYKEVVAKQGVLVTGHVSDSDLSSLYTGAEALVYPSLYEGFGLPILDAFSCGVPVITSKTGSMQEVSGSAACLVDPTSVLSIKEGIEKVLKNKSMWIAKGTKRVKEYSWTKTAAQTLAVYNEKQ